MNRRLLLVLAISVAFAATAGLLATAHGRSTPKGRPGLNVLLVTIDTLRADALGSYGDREAATPVLDRLTESGVRFERARAHNVVTLPSHANILSGRYPFEHGLRDNAGYRFPAGLDTLATLLKARGYRTGAFVSAFPLDSRFGLDRGFDVYDDRLGDPERVASFRMTERRGAETVAAARSFIAAETGRPWFCWVHLYEPHAPYEPPSATLAPRFAEAPYRGEVAAADAALGPLLEPFTSAGPDGRTLVVVTSDHGESLGEHGEKTHGVFAYEATLRVPLILFAPALFGPRVVADPVRHVDILPTVLDALAAPLPPDLPGRSLLASVGGQPLAPVASYFEALTAAANRGWAPLHGVVREERKYIRLPVPELYELAEDPAEKSNLATSRPDRLAALRSLLAEFPAEAAGSPRQAETPETRARLQSLGYLASSAPGGQVAEAGDPKRLIVYEAMLEDAVALQAQGDLPGALRVGRELLRQQPDSALALLHVAVLEHDAGNGAAALGLLEHALATSPGEPQAAALLGRYLVEAGRPEEAAKRLSGVTARETPDVDVLMALGAALAHAGRTEEGLRELTRARDIDPTNALAWLNLGTVHLMTGRLEDARVALGAALEREPTLSRAHTSLGVVAARRQDAAAAILHWKRAVELNPGEYDALFNLGTLLLKEGHRTEAVAYLDRFARDAPPSLYAVDIREVKRLLGAAARRGRG